MSIFEFVSVPFLPAVIIVGEPSVLSTLHYTESTPPRGLKPSSTKTMDALAYAAATTAKSWTADEEHKLINHMARVFEPGFDMNHIFPILSEKSLGEIKEKWKEITSTLLKNSPVEQQQPHVSHGMPTPALPPVVSRAYPQNMPPNVQAYATRTQPPKRKFPEPPQPIHAPQKKKQGRPQKNAATEVVTSTGPPWEKEDAERLEQLMENYQDSKSPQWDQIAANFPGRTAVDCLTQWHKMIPADRVRGKGSWTAEEDAVLISKHAFFGRKWSKISEFLPGRAGKQCRERYVNHLDPNLKKGAEWTDDEEAILISLHKNHGNKWTLIANQLPGRSDNDVKNHFNSTISRKFQVHGRDRLVEAAIQQVQMLIKAGMVPADLLTRLPSLPFDELDKAPVIVPQKSEPPKTKKNYIPPHLASRPGGYPVPPSYDYINFPHPGGPYSRVVPQYPYQYPNLTKAPQGDPNPAEAHPQQDEALLSGVTASAEIESAEDAESMEEAEAEDKHEKAAVDVEHKI
jgi:hypothetical protein